MKRFDLIIVGAGSAGLCAAIEAASCGMKVAIFDENPKPGGQLIRQTHKFFGSKEYNAKKRCFTIGTELFREACLLGVEVFLNSPVVGLYKNREIVVRCESSVYHYKGDSIIVATGASENMIAFDGWTLPGVMGAGAVQTMININRVRPGSRALVLGSANHALVTGFQLLQAGCEVAAVVDAAPNVCGYGVHAACLARTGVPFYLSHAIVKACGKESVTGAVIAEADSALNIIEGTEKHFDVDTICIATGLSPATRLLKMAGCKMTQASGTCLPVCGPSGETSISCLYAAGDITGIKEAQAAMREGRISATAAANRLGFLSVHDFHRRHEELEDVLKDLREGMFAIENKGRVTARTNEGYDMSCTLLKNGYIGEDEVAMYPGTRSASGTSGVKVRPFIECVQNIPCNPCRDSCPRGCIKVPERVTALPEYNEKSICGGCGLCVVSCPGQAIFLVDEDKGTVTRPYEFLPLPEKGETGIALGRNGEELCPSVITDVKTMAAFDKTALVTISVPKEYTPRARFWKRGAAHA
jgi:thioredoxin reductase/Fe-S-cluster-containing hydrogenase component 2